MVDFLSLRLPSALLLLMFAWGVESFGVVPSVHGRQQSSALMLQTGTVKWFDVAKGYGFIVPDDGSQDVFVHQSVIKAEGFRSLDQGEPVEFDVKTDDSGRAQAIDVTGPDGADVKGAPRPEYDDDFF